jgi:hypothetical protein
MKLTPEITQGTRTFHLRDSLHAPGVDLTLVLRRSGADIVGGIAICNPIDQFSRRIGRSVAFTRLLTGELPLVENDRRSWNRLEAGNYRGVEEQVLLLLDKLRVPTSRQLYDTLEAIFDGLEAEEEATGDGEVEPLENNAAVV